jgi:hypothetical protein
MKLVRRVAALFLGAWLALAAAVLLAPVSMHLGVLDALRVPVLILAPVAVIVAVMVRALRRGTFAFALGILLLAPWAMTGTVPQVTGGRDIELIVLPSSSREAFDYALSQQPDIIVVPDLSDRMIGFLGGEPGLISQPTGFDAPLQHLEKVSDDYRPWLTDGKSGIGIFLRMDSMPLDGIRLRPAPAAPFLIFDARIAGTELTFAVLHLARPFPVGAFGRQADEVEGIAAALAEIPRPVIVAGDFNALPWSAATAAIGEAIDAGASKWAGTFPARAPLRLPIDQVLVGRSLTITALMAGPDVGSVHLPLLATIALPR